MFKKLFGLGSKQMKNNRSSINWSSENIEEVPDPVFAGRMMGDGA